MPDVLIKNATVVDGTGADPRPNTSVFICGDRIHGLGEEADLKARFREGIRLIDAAGHTELESPALVSSCPCSM